MHTIQIRSAMTMTTTIAATSSPTSAADAIAADAMPTATESTTTAATKGTAGRTDYTSWERRASELNRRLEDEDDARPQARLGGDRARREARRVRGRGRGEGEGAGREEDEEGA